MTSQEIMQDIRLTRVRALRDEVVRLKGELASVRGELDSLREHFALALLAARDAERAGPDGLMLIVDGWNAILSSASSMYRGNASNGWRAQLAEAVEKWLEKRPSDHAWIVFDGPRASGRTKGRLRISYTGGSGEHRADRLVCDYLRMRRYDGAKGHVIVVTNDKAFRLEAARLGAEVSGIEEIDGSWALAIEKEKRWLER